MPLIVYLHGGSGKGGNLDLLTNGDGFPKYIKDGKIRDVPAYIIMPQLPSDKMGWTDVKTSLNELINSIANSYNIDRNRISITGHSMGGTGTWGISVAYPALFSCIAPMSGSIKLLPSNTDALSSIPVWAFVGSGDTIVEPSSSVLFIDALSKKNNNTKITIFDGATHFDILGLAYMNNNINIVDWLISHSK